MITYVVRYVTGGKMAETIVRARNRREARVRLFQDPGPVEMGLATFLSARPVQPCTRVLCTYCGKVLRLDPCLSHDSHGACETCAQEHLS